MASSSEEGKAKSEKERLKIKTLESVHTVVSIRSELPPKLKNVQAEILKNEESQAENVTVLPSSDINKITSKYSLTEPLPEELNISKEMPSQPKELQTRVEELSKNQLGLTKAMKELPKNKE